MSISSARSRRFSAFWCGRCKTAWCSFTRLLMACSAWRDSCSRRCFGRIESRNLERTGAVADKWRLQTRRPPASSRRRLNDIQVWINYDGIYQLLVVLVVDLACDCGDCRRLLASVPAVRAARAANQPRRKRRRARSSQLVLAVGFLIATHRDERTPRSRPEFVPGSTAPRRATPPTWNLIAFGTHPARTRIESAQARRCAILRRHRWHEHLAHRPHLDPHGRLRADLVEHRSATASMNFMPGCWGSASP